MAGPWETKSNDKPWKKTVIRQGDKNTTTPTTKYDMEASDVIKSPLELAEEIGPAATQRLKEAREMGSFKKTMVHAGRTVDKLGAGTADIGDFIAYVAGDEGAIDRNIDRQKDQAQKDKLFQQMEQDGGWESVVGGSLPYVAIDAAIGPFARKLASAGISGLGNLAVKGGKEGGGMLASGIKAASELNIPGITPLAKQMKKEWVKPVQKYAQGASKRYPRVDIKSEAWLPDVVGGTATGAVEGGLHYDRNMAEGAVSGAYGGVAGTAARPLLSKMPDQYGSKNISDTLDWAHDQGFRKLPGFQTGLRRWQSAESAMRSSDEYSSLVSGFDKANNRAINATAYKAMGVPRDKIEDMGTKEFKAHIDSLRSNYETLVDGTKGRFDAEDITALYKHRAELAKTNTAEGRRNTKLVSDYIEDIRMHARTPTRGPDGRMKPTTLDGKEYQRIRRHIKQQIDTATHNKDLAKVDALKPLMDSLDMSLDKGIQHSGKYTSAQWKDLNEKYAMANLLQKSGFDVNGNIDMQKLATNLEATDMNRILQGEGGRVKDLHQIARLANIQKHQAGSDMTGLGISDATKTNKSRLAKFIIPEGVSSMKDKALFESYVRGWPKKSGLLNMNRKGLWQPSTFARSVHQDTQFIPDTASGIKDVWDIGTGTVGDMVDWYEEEKKKRLK